MEMTAAQQVVYIENRTFDEIEIGESATLRRTLSRADIELFAVMSGDVNPAHLDEEYAHTDMFHEIVGHGLWGGALISTLLGTKLPGPGTIYLEQTLSFRRPVKIGDTVTVSVVATAKDAERHRISFDCRCVNQRDETVIEGVAKVIAPVSKVRRPRVSLPEVHLHERGVLLRQIIAKARPLGAIRMAIAYPIDRDALLGAVQAAQEGLIVPVLIGPEQRITAIAAAHHLDIASLPLIPTEDSREAVDRAVALARSGEVDALMKGSLRTHEMMRRAVAPGTGLVADKPMSHVFVMEVPGFRRPLFITDAAMTVEPDLDAKRAIAQNVIDLAVALGVEEPKVAVLSAMETIYPGLRSTLEAAALAKMAERGQITGGTVDGPLGFDDAVSPAAARLKGIDSPVAGRADAFVVPDLESGAMLVKQLGYLGESQAAGIILGGRVPIVPPSRANSALERVASCAIAVLLVHSRDEDELVEDDASRSARVRQAVGNLTSPSND
jgi:phosphate acetyltransferase